MINRYKMKKVLGLCMVILLSSVSLFARDNKRHDRPRVDRDPAKRFEQVAAELKLDEKQKAELQKINEKYQAQATAQREVMKAEREKQLEAMKAEREKRHEKMLAVREQKNAEIKKVLTDEQYQQYLDKQKKRFDRDHDKARKHQKSQRKGNHRSK